MLCFTILVLRYRTIRCWVGLGAEYIVLFAVYHDQECSQHRPSTAVLYFVFREVPYLCFNIYYFASWYVFTYFYPSTGRRSIVIRIIQSVCHAKTVRPWNFLLGAQHSLCCCCCIGVCLDSRSLTDVGAHTCKHKAKGRTNWYVVTCFPLIIVSFLSYLVI